MLPMKAVRLQLGELLAADATTLAPAAGGNKVALIAAIFSLNENLVIGDLTLATFTGSTPLTAGTGTQPSGIDPTTGEQLITIKSPAGGFRWECTAAPGAAETIFGAALTDNAGAVLLAVLLLNTPVVIAAVGQEIDLGAIQLRIVQAPVS